MIEWAYNRGCLAAQRPEGLGITGSPTTTREVRDSYLQGYYDTKHGVRRAA